MSNNSLYFTQYMGPLFLIKPTEHNVYKVKKTAYDTCTNKKCVNYLNREMPLDTFCTKCGTQTGTVKYDMEVQLRPHHIDEKIGNYLYNPFTHNKVLDNSLVYLSHVKEKEFNKGILAYHEYFVLCDNKKCNNFEEQLNPDNVYCPDCGVKAKLVDEKEVFGLFKKKEFKSLFKKYGEPDLKESFKILNDKVFDEILKEYVNSDICKHHIKILEKAYGKNSVSVVIALAKYIENV